MGEREGYGRACGCAEGAKSGLWKEGSGGPPGEALRGGGLFKTGFGVQASWAWPSAEPTADAGAAGTAAGGRGAAAGAHGGALPLVTRGTERAGAVGIGHGQNEGHNL